MIPRLTGAAGALAALLAAGLASAQAPDLQGRNDVQISIRARGAAEGGVIRGVELTGEAADEDAARAYGFRSMRQVVDVDCTSRRDRVVQMQAFPGHGQRGEAAARRAPGQWAQPSPDAYLADVISAVCRGGAIPRDAAPPQLHASAAPAAPAFEPPHAVAIAAADPPPAPPAPRRPAPVLRAAPVRAAAAPKPAPVLAAPIAAVAIVSGPLSPRAAPAPAAAAARGRAFTAQVGAAASPEGARQALGRVAGLMAGGVAGRVEAATVGGRLYYRASVEGFASREAAAGFCLKVERAGGACWAR